MSQPQIRTKVARLDTWPGKPWCVSLSMTTHKGIQVSDWSIWKTWRGAMRAAARMNEWHLRIEQKDIARTAALAEFDRSYRAGEP